MFPVLKSCIVNKPQYKSLMVCLSLWTSHSIADTCVQVYKRILVWEVDGGEVGEKNVLVDLNMAHYISCAILQPDERPIIHLPSVIWPNGNSTLDLTMEMLGQDISGGMVNCSIYTYGSLQAR